MLARIERMGCSLYACVFTGLMRNGKMKWPADIDGKPNKAIGNNPRGDTGDSSAVYDHSLPWKSSIIHCGRYRRLI
jgi:hypothetical protein